VYVWRIQSGGYEGANSMPGGSGGEAGASSDGSSGAAPAPPTPPAGAGDFTDLQPVTKFRAHDKYLTKCLLSPDVR
jgi:G protein beta subunit-like protein